MTITPLAGTSQIATALTALGTTAFGDSETDLYKQLLVALSAGGSGPVPPEWTPADIADLAIFFWFKPGEGTCFSDVAGTTPAAAGDAVKNVTALYGAQVTEATEATNFPTLQADGLQLDDLGVQQLVFSSQFSSGTFTAYWSMIVGEGSNVAAFAADSVENSFLGGGAAVTIRDDDDQGAFSGLDGTGIFILGRFNQTVAGGSYSMIATGMPESTDSGFTHTNFSFNQIGGTGAFGYGNDSTANRFRLLILVNRSIALGSAEDLLIRDWITTNDGAAL